MTRRERSFHRQFDALVRLVHPLRGRMSALRSASWFPVGFPLDLRLVAGGLFPTLSIATWHFFRRDHDLPTAPGSSILQPSQDGDRTLTP